MCIVFSEFAFLSNIFLKIKFTLFILILNFNLNQIFVVAPGKIWGGGASASPNKINAVKSWKNCVEIRGKLDRFIYVWPNTYDKRKGPLIAF